MAEPEAVDERWWEEWRRQISSLTDEEISGMLTQDDLDALKAAQKGENHDRG